MIDEEFESIELLRLKYRKRDQIIHAAKLVPLPEIRSPVFNFQKFQGSDKSTTELCRKHWNVINDEELGSRKLLELKYRSGDQIILTFYKTGSPRNYVPLT